MRQWAFAIPRIVFASPKYRLHCIYIPGGLQVRVKRDGKPDATVSRCDSIQGLMRAKGSFHSVQGLSEEDLAQPIECNPDGSLTYGEANYEEASSVTLYGDPVMAGFPLGGERTGRSPFPDRRSGASTG